MAGQANNANIVTEIFPTELSTDSQLLSKCKDLSFKSEIAETMSCRSISLGRQVIEVMSAEVGMEKLIKKRNQLTAYLEFILHEIDAELDGADFEIITPSNQEERACQLSVFLHGQGRSLFDYLMQNGVITDWREPNVIRLAPAPFYCLYEDMYEFGQILKQGILTLNNK